MSVGSGFCGGMSCQWIPGSVAIRPQDWSSTPQSGHPLQESRIVASFL